MDYFLHLVDDGNARIPIQCPRLLRDPIVRASSALSLRQDDGRGSKKQPLVLRLLQRLS